MISMSECWWWIILFGNLVTSIDTAWPVMGNAIPCHGMYSTSHERTLHISIASSLSWLYHPCLFLLWTSIALILQETTAFILPSRLLHWLIDTPWSCLSYNSMKCIPYLQLYWWKWYSSVQKVQNYSWKFFISSHRDAYLYVPILS